jgi:predicted amidohydrolase
MKICVAQTKPIQGDLDRNITDHLRFIDVAVTNLANVIIFPELSLTGYEQGLAQTLAIQTDDIRLEVFQTASNNNDITIGVGVPTRSSNGICISVILFQPHQVRRVYSKEYLHPDENEYFVSGDRFPVFSSKGTSLALAVCYELSVDEHAKLAFAHGADYYLATVAKSVNGVDAAWERLSEIAVHYSCPVLMANSIGPTTDFECAGRSAVWNNHGKRIGELNDQEEGLLLFDTEKNATVRLALSMK